MNHFTGDLTHLVIHSKCSCLKKFLVKFTFKTGDSSIHYPCDRVVSDDAVDGGVGVVDGESETDAVVSDDAVDVGVGVVAGESETDAPPPCGAEDVEVGAADVEDVVLFGGRSVTIPAVATECGVPRGRSWVKLVLNSL